MLDLTKEQMKQKFRQDTKMYWAIVIIAQGSMLIALSWHVMSSILMAAICMTAVAHLLVYVRFIATFSLPKSYYEDLELCSVCGQTSVKRVNRARCLACGDETDG